MKGYRKEYTFLIRYEAVQEWNRMILNIAPVGVAPTENDERGHQ